MAAWLSKTQKSLTALWWGGEHSKSPGLEGTFKTIDNSKCLQIILSTETDLKANSSSLLRACLAVFERAIQMETWLGEVLYSDKGNCRPEQN